ncbi:Epoxyqueuosine (oQ) reductase QueG [Thioalkalivibrio nitratireducens DSM 14787]|uniref:Epoxyqueuosine reductase n=1 Tax=Thioalkalivibrio nitratireducens (strain DSM 14787 / UNIQEM 213 / ALEN2) TaxID=1255043 RepID=L0E1C6_THIND|nr:tRNA epoxyqueuosine(34) reductase QueG [Thioalkalivibrio nitratireducens]AGA34421.1 Epoxyqueuosine (oQ) reductase QueG [Thioalkalivibrio nitratireducens DSM 14787]
MGCSPIVPQTLTPSQCLDLAGRIRDWGHELGFRAVGITRASVGIHAERLDAWLAQGSHGEMRWMADRAELRRDPARLVPGVQRIVSLRMDYLPPATARPEAILADPDRAYVSRYALGRDYHKLIRRRIQTLADWIETEVGPFGYRAFTDSAPVLEKALAERAGLGWIGKHTNLLAREAGSWFFLGELFTDLPLPIDDPSEAHCGSCRACLDICPTQAFRGPYDLDARRCISYLTIEHPGAIPESLRPMLGNRVYGCDDCQLVCPWNRFAGLSVEPDFAARHGLDAAGLIDLFAWDEARFLERTAGMAIRRIGHERWLRNLAVALGNGPATPEAIAALERRAGHPSALVREHVGWALERLRRGPGPRRRA